MKFIFFIALFLLSCFSLRWTNAHLSPVLLSAVGLLVSCGSVRFLADNEKWLRFVSWGEKICLNPWRYFTLVVAFGVFFTATVICYFVLDPIPHIQDSFAYYFQAKTFANGRLWAPIPDLHQFFNMPWVGVFGGKKFSIMPPGWPMILAAGIKLGVAPLVNPLLGAFSLLTMYILWKEIFGFQKARAAIVLCALSPFFLFLSAGFMSHPASLLFSSLFALCYLLAHKKKQIVWALFAGLFCGIIALIRPLNAGLLWLAMAGFFIVHKRNRLALMISAISIVGVCAGYFVHFLYNYMLIGEWFVPPPYLVHPNNKLGFGKEIGLDWGLFETPGHNIWRALLNLQYNVAVMNNDLFGWPLASLLFVLILLCFGKFDWRHRLCWTMIGVYAFGYMFWWFSGVVFGARYYYSLIPFLVVLTVEGMAQTPAILRKLFNAERYTFKFSMLVRAIVPVFFLYTFLVYVPKISLGPYSNQRNISYDVYNLLRKSAQEEELWFLEVEIPFHAAPWLVSNSINILENGALYALDLGKNENEKLIEMFPNRKPRYFLYNPQYEEALNNLGHSFKAQGKLNEAIRHYSEALRVNPDLVEAHNNLGLVFVSQAKVGEALWHYSEALRLNPDSAAVHINLGNALVGQGRAAEASVHYSEALRLNPDSVEAHNNLGAALIYRGKIEEAILHFQEALRIKPDYADAHDNLKKALTVRRSVH